MLVLRIAHRIRKETKQEPGTAGPGNILGCCLVAFHFLWVILSTSTVEQGHSLDCHNSPSKAASDTSSKVCLMQFMKAKYGNLNLDLDLIRPQNPWPIDIESSVSIWTGSSLPYIQGSHTSDMVSR